MILLILRTAENVNIYGERDGKPFNGIDEFGDIILTRTITHHNGQYITGKKKIHGRPDDSF